MNENNTPEVGSPNSIGVPIPLISLGTITNTCLGTVDMTNIAPGCTATDIISVEGFDPMTQWLNLIPIVIGIQMSPPPSSDSTGYFISFNTVIGNQIQVNVSATGDIAWIQFQVLGLISPLNNTTQVAR